MNLFTFGQIQTELRKELDLQDDENFVSQDEFATYYNDAVDDAEGEIMNLFEDYFLAKSTITLVAGTQGYDLPSNIYAQKIVRLLYVNGTRIYPINRIVGEDPLLSKALVDNLPRGSEEYQYQLVSTTEEAQSKIEFSPTPQESGAYIVIWYIRNAKRVGMQSDGTSSATQLATICDIPEWKAYIKQYIRVRVFEKEKDSRLQAALVGLEAIKTKMTSALTNRTPDRQDRIPLDISFYEECN